MPARFFVSRVAALLVLISANACDATTAPDDFVAEYALVSLASQALPASPSTHEPVTTILADTVRLRSDGTGERVVSYVSGNLRALFADHDELTWRAIGDSLEVSFPCDDVILASCIAPPHLAGRIGPGMQWLIARATIYNEAPAVYQRVGMR